MFDPISAPPSQAAPSEPMVAAGKPRQTEPYDAFKGGRRSRGGQVEVRSRGLRPFLHTIREKPSSLCPLLRPPMAGT